MGDNCRKEWGRERWTHYQQIGIAASSCLLVKGIFDVFSDLLNGL